VVTVDGDNTAATGGSGCLPLAMVAGTPFRQLIARAQVLSCISHDGPYCLSGKAASSWMQGNHGVATVRIPTEDSQSVRPNFLVAKISNDLFFYNWSEVRDSS
jgi:hypothetical protein